MSKIAQQKNLGPMTDTKKRRVTLMEERPGMPDKGQQEVLRIAATLMSGDGASNRAAESAVT